MARAMKDSGVEWLGQIPADWNVMRLKYLRNNETDSFQDGDWIDAPFITDEGIRYLTTGNVGDGIFKRQGNGHISEDTFFELNCKYAYPNDLVISRLNAPYGRACILPSDEEKYILAVDIVILRTDHDKRFLCYLTQCQGYQNTVKDNAKGTTMKRISRTNLGNIYLPVAPLDEQQRIADFLDGECARIDSVVEKTRASIEEYRKLKQAIITRAVTKGIRPNRPTKSSGVDWLGDIPADWKIIKLKYVLQQPLQYGANQAGIPYDSTLPRYIRITDITTDGKLKDLGALSLSEEDAEGYILQNNDVLFARSGATVGKAFIYKKEYGKAAFAGYLIRAALSKKLLPDLFFHYTQSSAYEEWKNQIFIQSTIQNIGADRYREMPIILPPLVEQREIAAYLDEKTAAIDLLIAKKIQLAAELEQLKKSLIFEYVTGKKELQS